MDMDAKQCDLIHGSVRYGGKECRVVGYVMIGKDIKYIWIQTEHGSKLIPLGGKDVQMSNVQTRVSP